MIYYKTDEEIELIRESCLVVSKTLAHVASILKPGITGKEVDLSAEEFLRSLGAIPAFKGYKNFPATLCISKNEAVVHGIPNSVPFIDGDIVSVDCGSFKNGFFGDAAFTFAIGEVSDEIHGLLSATLESLYVGIESVIKNNRIGDIGFAVQNYVEQKGYSVVRELVGHGIGRSLHEDPEVANFGKRGQGPRLKEGLVIAIEPMINLGKKDVVTDKDGWTIRTSDFTASAHYEHTVALRQNGVDILSDHSFIIEEIKKNKNLSEISINNTIFALRN